MIKTGGKSALYWFNANRLGDDFPALDEALREPDGLLAAGGDLGPDRLLDAYRRGIFPWYAAGQPILWWSPDPRAILWPGQVHASRSLRRSRRRNPLRITYDQAFAAVVAACRAPRGGQHGTWITNEMQQAYGELHRRGFAHSIECWQDSKLVGGLYGVSLGQVFFGESMFSRVTDASKHALVELSASLLRWNYRLIDCQVQNPHLISMGAQTIPRPEFAAMLHEFCTGAPATDAWCRVAEDPA